MPTGYTSSIYEDKPTTLREFILKCSHAFIAELHDTSIDSDVPRHANPHSLEHYQQQVLTAQANKARWTTASATEVAAAALHDYEEFHAEWVDYEERQVRLRERYENMLDEVHAWAITDDRLQPLKDFMVQQLESSIAHDTGYTMPEPHQRGVDEFRAAKIGSAKRDIEYYSERIAKELERARKNNEWIDAFWESLPQDPEKI